MKMAISEIENSVVEDSAMRSTTLPVVRRLYGAFFQKVDTCLRVMEASHGVAVGWPVNAVLQGTGAPCDGVLSILIDNRLCQGSEVMQWHDYLHLEGYRFVRGEAVDGLDGEADVRNVR